MWTRNTFRWKRRGNEREHMELKEKDLNAHKWEVCRYCRYFSGAGFKVNDMVNHYCEYIMITGKRRPCHFMDCVEKGVFKPVMKPGKKKK